MQTIGSRVVWCKVMNPLTVTVASSCHALRMVPVPINYLAEPVAQIDFILLPEVCQKGVRIEVQVRIHVCDSAEYSSHEIGLSGLEVDKKRRIAVGNSHRNQDRHTDTVSYSSFDPMP